VGGEKGALVLLSYFGSLYPQGKKEASDQSQFVDFMCGSTGNRLKKWLVSVDSDERSSPEEGSSSKRVKKKRRSSLGYRRGTYRGKNASMDLRSLRKWKSVSFGG